jgi:hypothetical protein
MAIEVNYWIILAPTARRSPTNDGAIMRPPVNMAHQHGPMGLVLADAEFDSERHQQYIRHVVQAQSVIPAK